MTRPFWQMVQGGRAEGTLGDSGLDDADGLPNLGASRVQARWAPVVLSCSASPTLTQLSLSCLPSPSHPLGAHSAPVSRFPMCFPFSHVCAAPEVGAVPLGQPAPPLLSVRSGPQPPAQLSLGQERHVSRAPWGAVGVGWGKGMGGQCPGWEEGGISSAQCPGELALPTYCLTLSGARDKVAEGNGE